MGSCKSQSRVLTSDLNDGNELADQALCFRHCQIQAATQFKAHDLTVVLNLGFSKRQVVS